MTQRFGRRVFEEERGPTREQVTDLPLFWTAQHPDDRRKVQEAHTAIMAHADGHFRDKATWAALAGCSEHAFSARLSEVRRWFGYRTERRKASEGHLLGSYLYAVRKS